MEVSCQFHRARQMLQHHNSVGPPVNFHAFMRATVKEYIPSK
jgi:hypothetical protein